MEDRIADIVNFESQAEAELWLREHGWTWQRPGKAGGVRAVYRRYDGVATLHDDDDGCSVLLS